MSNLRTYINWMLNDYCTSECSYCPIRLRGGEQPRGILEYMAVTQKIIDHYDALGRKIDWAFSGGEPLDMFDFPMMLKLCKERGGTIDLTTNGGKLWMDWWAIEPHIDYLHLTYHYWQNPKLIKFIIQTFQKAKKEIHIVSPVRPDHFDEDIARISEMESECEIQIGKSILYNEADPIGGMFPYTEQQLRIIRGEELVQVQQYFKETTLEERYENKIEENPVYTGYLCNAGIEKLIISHQGWVAGSSCNDKPLGNLWSPTFQLPSAPHRCGMRACVDNADQKITKFNL